MSEEERSSSIGKGNYISIGLAITILAGIVFLDDRIGQVKEMAAAVKTDVRILYEVGKHNSASITTIQGSLKSIEADIVRLRLELERIKAKNGEKDK